MVQGTDLASDERVVHRGLRRLRARLTAWYLGTLAITLLILGVGLFMTITRQLDRFLDRTLRERIASVEHAARTHQSDEDARPGGLASLDDIRFVDRNVFLLTVDGKPIAPDTAPAWVYGIARKAGTVGQYAGEASPSGSGENEGGVLVRAERFALTDSVAIVAVAAVDSSEWEEQYSRLMAAFGVAAILALVLIAGGGWLLVRKSTAPIERSIAQMRQFMSDAAHELRTPVTVIRAGAEVALDQPRDAAGYATALAGVAAESRRLGVILDDLLILARADAGERPMEKTAVFLDDVATDAANAARPLAQAAGVTLDVEQFDEAEVIGDAAMLRQLVMILLDNAVKFTPRSGAVHLRVGMDDGMPSVVIRDTGIGIAPGDLPHVFERFFRVNRARLREDAGGRGDSGAGLGLAIAQWIADAHKARIILVSNWGMGTAVTVRFPAVGGPANHGR